MLIPVRCFTCNKIVGRKSMWDTYCKLTKNNVDADEIFKKIGLRRYCCKRMYITHIDLIDEVIMYDNHKYVYNNDENDLKEKKIEN